MESLKLSFESVMPIFLLMSLGYALKALKMAKKEHFDAMNKLIFKVFLPTLLFYNIYTTDIGDAFYPELIIFTVLGILCVFVLSYIAVMLISKENSVRGVMLQGFFRSNYAILGLPLVGYVCGDAAGGMSSVMVAVIVPLFNILAVIALERFRDGRIYPLKLLKGIVTNPLVIGCVLGGIFLLSKITLPRFLDSAVSSVSSIASPLAMIVLGASFTFSGLGGKTKELIVTVSARLLLVPAVMVTAAALLGFRGEALACILVAFGSPVAVSSFAMAQQMGGDEQLAAQIVVVSSAACLITLFGFIFVLNSLALF